ncbi:hypothetical protein FO519_007975, partial [Halicephalobus sp. NKZ332]
MPEPTVAQVVNLSQEEENRVKEFSQRILGKTAVGVVTYPLTFAKTLHQIGHEPFPLTTGKVFVFAGRDAYFLPNTFKYLKNVYKDQGFKTLFTGLDAGILSHLTGGVFSFVTELYLDRYYPEIGGKPSGAEKEEAEMTDHESFNFHFRKAVRDTICCTVGTIVSRPLTVVMIREVAQLVGGEQKYNSLCGSILRIGFEEGPNGFFSGLVPALIAQGITIWGCFALSYGLERALVRAQEGNPDDEAAKKATKDARSVLRVVVPFFVNSFSYPFSVISTVMSLNGSGLAVSLLPYSPSFNYWGDCYDYLKP